MFQNQDTDLQKTHCHNTITQLLQSPNSLLFWQGKDLLQVALVSGIKAEVSRNIYKGMFQSYSQRIRS